MSRDARTELKKGGDGDKLEDSSLGDGDAATVQFFSSAPSAGSESELGDDWPNDAFVADAAHFARRRRLRIIVWTLVVVCAVVGTMAAAATLWRQEAQPSPAPSIERAGMRLLGTSYSRDAAARAFKKSRSLPS